jgi:hypothetical protein
MRIETYVCISSFHQPQRVYFDFMKQPKDWWFLCLKDLIIPFLQHHPNATEPKELQEWTASTGAPCWIDKLNKYIIVWNLNKFLTYDYYFYLTNILFIVSFFSFFEGTNSTVHLQGLCLKSEFFFYSVWTNTPKLTLDNWTWNLESY